MSTEHVDEWVWGKERILWGYDQSHQYTLKVIEPKLGRTGCLSLQYHHHKSESWVVWRGIAWALLICNDKVCTRIMRAGDVQNIECGIIHRLMAVSSDLQMLEPSTPDQHAADKSKTKDVVRLHCVHGRPADPARNQREGELVSEAIRVTEEAILEIEGGRVPKEYNLGFIETGTVLRL